MADPLTILGATAASSQLFAQGTKVVKFLWDLQDNMENAPPQVRQQTGHVTQLINLAKIFIDTPSLHAQPVVLTLETCLTQAHSILAVLQELTVGKEDSLANKLYKQYRFAMKENEILQMFDRLEREKMSLILGIHQVDNVLLSAINLDTKHTRDQLDDVVLVVENTALRVTSIVNRLEPLPRLASQVDEIHTAMKSLPIRTAKTQAETFRATTHFLIPNRLVGRFIGQKAVLERISDAFAQPNNSSSSNIVTISGLGGVGKTQLALEHCRKAQGDGVKAIFWINAMSMDDVLKSFRSVSNVIKDFQGNIPDDQIVSFVLEKLSSWPDPWLLVFDNHDDLSAFHLPECFPRSVRGFILVTSRDTRVERLSPKSAIQLSGFTELDALKLLFDQNPTAQTETNADEHGKTIVERLGYHPLAIAQAGSYIHQRRLALDTFLEHYEKQKEDILEHTLPMSGYRKEVSAAAKQTSLNVCTTWELSYQLLKNAEGEVERQEDFLTLFAFFDSTDISEEIFKIYCQRTKPLKTSEIFLESLMAQFHADEEGWAHSRFETMLLNLTQRSLVQAWSRDANGNCHLNLHPLIRDWIRLRTDIDIFKSSTVAEAKVLTEVLANYRDGSDHFIMPVSTRLAVLSHIEAYIENYRSLEQKLDSTEFQALYKDLIHPESWFSNFLDENGKSHTAMKMAEQLAIWCENQYGLKHKDSLRSRSVYAALLRDNGDLQESESLFRRLLVTCEEMHGPEHDETLEILADFALVLRNQNRYEEAEHAFQRILGIKKAALGDDFDENPDVLLTLHNLAFVLSSQQKYEIAETLFQKVVESTEKVLGYTHPRVVQSKFELALVFREQEKYKDAESLSRRVVKVREKVLGDTHPDTLQSVDTLAVILKEQGKYEESERLYRRAIEGWEKVQGHTHLYTLGSVYGLALCLEIQKKYQESERLYRRAIEGQTTLGNDPADTLTTIYNLAILLEDQGRDDEALVLFERAATTSLALLGAEHTDTKFYAEVYHAFKEIFQGKVSLPGGGLVTEEEAPCKEGGYREESEDETAIGERDEEGIELQRISRETEGTQADLDIYDA